MHHEILNKVTAYDGFFKIIKLEIQYELFSGAMSKSIVRELFERGHSVAILLHDVALKRIILVKQFRVGAVNDENPWLVELPAGMIEANEAPEDVATRESQEETGLLPTKLHQICEYYNSAGGSSEKTTIYYVQVDSSNVAEFAGLATENEDIKVLAVPEQEFIASVKGGEYKTSSLLIAGHWFINSGYAT